MDEENEHRNVSGRVKFDDRGNAVWEWAMATGAFGRDVSQSARVRSIADASALSIVDDGPPPSETVKINPLGVKNGYDPYESGKLVKDRGKVGNKRDLRKLSEWLKLKKQAEENKKNQDDPE